VVTGRKNILRRTLSSDSRTASLAKNLEGTCAIVMSNENPFELYKEFKGSAIKLAAKPNQKAPADINIEAGETPLPPGQAVTELKSAGIDVKIDKGKVLISKAKTLVHKDEVITLNVAKALHTLNVLPFTAELKPSAIFNEGYIFTQELLELDSKRMAEDIARAFGSALAFSFEAKIINKYTVKKFVEEAYRNAMALGVGAKIYDSKVIDALLANAYAAASTLGSLVGS
jgi:Ribosomal protein L10.